jgi:hypothetical protein
VSERDDAFLDEVLTHIIVGGYSLRLGPVKVQAIKDAVSACVRASVAERERRRKPGEVIS